MGERARENGPLAVVKSVSARADSGVARTPTPSFHSFERAQSVNHQTGRFNAIAIH